MHVPQPLSVGLLPSPTVRTEDPKPVAVHKRLAPDNNPLSPAVAGPTSEAKKRKIDTQSTLDNRDADDEKVT
jgi:hypothetical protein